MKHNFARRMAIGAVAAWSVAGIVAVAPGSAVAAPTTTAASNAVASSTAATQVSNPRCTAALFAQAQQLVEVDLAGRVTQLNALATAAGNTANHLTTGDRQTLQTDITTVELPGIEALQSQAQSATTCAGLRVVARSMVFTYRVYVVMTPQTHLTIVVDDETYIEGVFANLEPQIATAIQNAQAAGKDVTAAQAAFTDLKSQVSTAQGETSGQAAQILAQTPAGYPGNWQVFLGARTNASNAHTDLAAAYADAQRIRTDLQ
ncbi:MAG TPA: hypothetical protein VII76_03095 [Acidimicrobiales bacterium]